MPFNKVLSSILCTAMNTFVLLFLFAIFILNFLQVQSDQIENSTVDVENLSAVNGDKFYYFGYGSNMLAKRIHIQNPTAARIGPAFLKDYRLDFNYVSSRWQGSASTVVQHFNRTVQGALWEIDLSNLDDIDNQEGVHLGIYKAINVSVIQFNNKTVTARVYLLVKQPATDLQELEHESIPLERQPSKTYLQCLVQGAIETGIETPYIEWLKSVKHNGNVVEPLETTLGLSEVQLNS